MVAEVTILIEGEVECESGGGHDSIGSSTAASAGVPAGD